MAYKKPEDRVTTVDPRQSAFKSFYIDPNSDTFANARGSAIRAGYTETYADNITAQQPKWLADILTDTSVRRAEMLAYSERNLNTVVSTDEPEDREDKKMWLDTSKYVSGTLGKQHYSTRQEVTGADGKRLFSNEQRTNASIPLTALFKPSVSTSSTDKDA